MKQITLFAIVLMAFSCSSEDSQPKPLVYQINSQFQLQVNAFFTEAEARGHGTFEKENLIVQELASGYTHPVHGFMATSRYYKDGKQRIVEVLRLDPIACQESPVFRELAHIFLNKAYEEDTNTIMDIFGSPCAYVHANGDFYSEIREAYLVELFGQ